MVINKTRNGIFITGTDTGVGKTHVGARLIRSLVDQGIKVIPRKPVESGCSLEHDQLVPSDGMTLMSAAGLSDINAVTPYRFEPALSPPRAATLSNKHLLMDQLVDTCQTKTEDFIVVEGAGGFLSPLSADGLNADLAASLGLPVLLVVADKLGCVNHCLLTLEAINNRGLNVAAVVLNRIEADKDGMDNLDEIERLSNIKVYPDSEIEQLARQLIPS
ncbi:MAG: dethiobiotin synthase [Gammaproteobacteria bacterium]|nr:dethiobiotin synthase [Gammaproteobacteria bacterium]